MDSNIIAALIGGGATIVAAIITVVFVSRARQSQQTLPAPQEGSAPAPTRRRRGQVRQPSLFWANVRGYFARLWDDPVGTINESLAKTLAVLITLAVAVMTVGAIGYALWQAVKGSMRW